MEDDLFTQMTNRLSDMLKHAGQVCFPDRDHGEISMQDMCEVIAEEKILVKKDGTFPTAKEIYAYSPTGELTEIFLWFVSAAEKREGRNG